MIDKSKSNKDNNKTVKINEIKELKTKKKNNIDEIKKNDINIFTNIKINSFNIIWKLSFFKLFSYLKGNKRMIMRFKIKNYVINETNIFHKTR